MRKKCLILVMFFSLFGLLFLFGNDVYASDGETNNQINQEEAELLVNEELTISVDGYSKVYINDNDSPIEKDTTLTESGIYNVKYVEIKTTTEKSTDENGNEVTRNIEQVVETYKTYCLVNVNLLNGETYFEEKEIILDEIENVSYYLNDELIENNIVCANEGLNELKITYKDSSKIISFYIFKFNDKEKLNVKNFYEIQTVDYTADTSAKVYLNGQEFDGNINTFGNYHFEVKNTKNELIGELAFVIDETIIINGTSYKALNSKITLKNNISLSTQAKIEYVLEPLTQTLSGKNIYNGYITYNPGLNTLKITGVGNYDLELAFNVTPVTNIIDNHTYTKEVLPIVSGGNVTINGYPYNQGSVINTAGSYEMIVNGLEQDNVIKYHFDLLPEEFNVINNKIYEEALIAAKTNNYMELSNKHYKSGKVIFNEGEYDFKIYYPTYEKNDLDNNPYNVNDYIKSKYYKVETYNFEIVAGLNIENGKEYYDNIQILFSGASKAKLTFEGKENEIESGFIAKKIGNYVLTFNDNDYAFSVTPSLNVEDSHIYLNNVCVLNNYDFNDSNATFTLTCEKGTKSASKKSFLTNGEILNEKLSSGTYSLEIKNDYYSKVINFIVISSDVVSRGAAYPNGKSFNIDMYGVNVYLNSPRTIDRIRENSLYEGEAIKTIGKHYLTFEFNGINTSSDLDTAIYFYILPIITLNDNVTTSTKLNSNSTKLNSNLEATLTFKDGNYNDIENDNYSPLKLDNNSNSNQINKKSDSTYYFNEIGNHYIDLNLDGYKYRITLTIDSYFYLKEDNETKIISSDSNETYLTTNNIYKEKVTFVNVDKTRYVSYTLDDNDIDINGVTITAVGNHKLYLKGVNNYSKTLTFIIKEDVEVNNELIEIKESYSDLIYKDAVSFNIFGDAEYLLDKNKYLNNELVETVGNHILTINGTNGYSTNYKFQIKENLIVNLNNTTLNTFDALYYEDFAFEINKDKIKSLKLNDEDLTNNIVDIKTIGNYELKIEGTNSYTNVYKFNVLPTLSFVSLDDEFNKFKSVYYNTVTPTLDNSKGLHYETVLLNNTLYDFDTLNTIGNYNLVLKGVGNYKETHNFEIKESLLYSFDNINYSSLNKNINIDENNIGKPIYIKKEFKDIIYINAKLNDDSILESALDDYLLIDTLGNNLLSINNNTYKISLKEINDNLYLNQEEAKENEIESINNIKFKDSLKYEILVDGKIYNDETIESFGLHKVEVKGFNYKNTYYFYISLNTNIINNESYVNNVLIESNAKDFNIYVGSGKLTQELLNKVGNYKITFNGLYGSKETYNINLISNLKIDGNDLNDVKTSNIIEVNYVNNSNEYKTILLNGKEFDFSPINTIGKNVLTLIDINGNQTNYNLVIDGKNYIKSSVYDNKILANNNSLDSFELNVNDSYEAKVVMDENPNYYGLHEIIINGVNDYKETYYYSIKLNTNVENKTYNEALNVIVNANYVIDGKEINNVDEVGNHTLTIFKQNLNDFIDVSIDFVIKENVSGFEKENNKAITPIILGNIKSIILSNNPSYKIGDKITKAGYYTLKVIGSNDYENEYEFSLIPLINFINYDFNSNLNTKEVYIKTDDLTFDLFVNGKAFDINDSINTIGNNTVLIKGFDYEYEKLITLNETIEVLNEYSFDDNYIPAVLNLKVKDLYLDGSLYDGLPVTAFGNHILTIKGENNYESSYSFKVNLNTNLINEGIYDKEVVINSNSKILVNDIETNKINLIGNNIVKFIGLNIEEEYIVTLKENVNGYSNDSYKSSHLLSFENVSGIILDDNRIDASNNVIEIEVKEVGNHTFKLLGLNNYESQTYSFTIIEDFTLEDSYNNEVLINVENVKGLLLNGKELENNTLVTLIGKYKLTVLGVNGYKNTYEFTINYNIEGIEDGGIYVGKAYAKTSNAKMTLDGNEYLSGDAIYEVGYHTLVVKGDGATDTYTYNFTILPDLTQNELVNDYELNDFTLNEAKAFNVSSDTKLVLTLNGKDYDGSLINKVGKYELVLEGSNGYKKTFSFTVEPEVMNVNSVYNDVFVADISDNLEYTLTLNGKAYDGSSVNRIGNYELVLTGVNGYSKVFNFTLEPEEIVIDSVYEEAFAFVLAGNLTCDYLLNGETYDGSSINKVGNYTLVLNGENYTKEFNFQIKETLSYLNGEVYEKLNSELIYNDEVIIRNDNDLQYEILLNDEEIASLTSINKLGNNKLVILGENGYKAQYNLLLKETVNFADSLSYKDSDSFTPSITNKLVGDILIDGLTTNTLKGFGKHIVTIKGLNYEKNYDLYIELDSNIEANDIYNESKEIVINSLFTIDGKEYNESKVLDEVGNHKIVILGSNGVTKELNITIIEKVTGIEDKGVYNSFVTPNIKNAKLVLDGKPFENETNVSLVGNHVLEVLGTNEYKKIYNFTINNKEFIDNQIVDESLLIDIPNAKLLVDGKEILNNTIIAEVGNHTLEVIGTNDYSNVYHFTVNNKEFVNDQVVLGSLLIDIPNAKLFVDGKEIENDTLINEVGYHTLEVIGVNNYSNEYKFTITPDTKIVQTETKNGMVASISSTNICKTISIDDVYYEAGQSYSNIGNHTLTITGSNGYEYKKDFTIDAALGVSDEGVYKDKVTINLLDANEIILDGVEMTKDVVISNGTHTLTIIGSNGYEKTVTFTYYNPNNMFVIICTISLCLVFITTLGATLFVKKRKGIK